MVVVVVVDAILCGIAETSLKMEQAVVEDHLRVNTDHGDFLFYSGLDLVQIVLVVSGEVVEVICIINQIFVGGEGGWHLNLLARAQGSCIHSMWEVYF